MKFTNFVQWTLSIIVFVSACYGVVAGSIGYIGGMVGSVITIMGGMFIILFIEYNS